ncbi:MAG: hypothetical protein MPJ24_06935 [Pirellulaceae bacterium]|nr:hypothetical protein [Pirellulaceae bacterium]
MKTKTTLLFLFFSAPFLANGQEENEMTKKKSKDNTETIVIDLSKTIVTQEIPFLKKHFGELLSDKKEPILRKTLPKFMPACVHIDFNDKVEVYNLPINYVCLVKDPNHLAESRNPRDKNNIGMLRLVSQKKCTKEEGLIALERILKGHAFPEEELEKIEVWQKGDAIHNLDVTKRSKSQDVKITVSLEWGGISSVNPDEIVYNLTLNVFFENKKIILGS